MRGSFFIHDAKDDINMLKLPNILAPRTAGKQVNSDIKKKSIFAGPPSSAEENTYSPEVFLAVESLIVRGKLNLNRLDVMDTATLQVTCKKVGINISSKNTKRQKSRIGLLEELKYVIRAWSAGQGPCHKVSFN